MNLAVKGQPGRVAHHVLGFDVVRVLNPAGLAFACGGGHAHA